MDANGQRFWLLGDREHWHPRNGRPPLRWDSGRRSLRLVSQREPPPWPVNPLEAFARLAAVPEARDAYGTTARWSPAAQRVVAGGALPGEVDVYAPPHGREPTDLAMGHDGVLYLAIDGRITMLSRRLHSDPAEVEAAGFQAWRLAAAPGHGVWALDAQHRRIGRVTGQLWPHELWGEYDPDVFRPVEENPDPPVLRVLAASWPEGERAAAIACSPGGRVAVLTWLADGTGVVRVLDERERLSEPTRLQGSLYPFSFAWLDEERVAVLLAGVAEAPAYPVVPGTALPVGDLYPLPDHDRGPFLHGLTLPPHYGTRAGPRPLHHLSLPSFAPSGEATNAVLLDSHDGQTVWHRLYLDASIPADCGIRVWLAATELPTPPVHDSDWYEHRAGSVFPPDAGGPPRAAWVPAPSELPFHRGLLHDDPEPGHAGLFTVLIQRTGRRVRSLRGRFLWVRVELISNRLASPELAAVRAYASRFSYRDQYLPELYRESLFGPDAEEPTPESTPSDFLDRLLANFEGVLTPLEDRVAHAYLLTDARTAPADALPWLASWVGLALEPALTPARRRAVLGAAPEMAHWHGTLRGLAGALDLATGGAVSGGEVVVLEDFRLRRTVATILGADLAAADDPLLPGLMVSGNSYVGDTLLLGEEERREFLALFGAGLPLSAQERAAVATLFESLAHRVTILVHQEVAPQDLGLIRRVARTETPAHVSARVVTTTYPFLVGIASLVGVDSYLAAKQPPGPVRVSSSRLGVRDFIQSPASLDPRLEGGSARPFEAPRSPQPTADPGHGFQVEYGKSFRLDASGSRPSPGRSLETYRWTWLV